jgi:predicted P-loop ATPase
LAVSNDPATRDTIYFDAMRQEVMVRHSMQDAPVIADNAFPRAIVDNDIVQLQHYLQKRGLTQITKRTIADAVEMWAHENVCHPIREYLDKLKWDGTPRVTGWLSTYLGAEKSLYVDGISRLVLLAMIARIDDPGCKFDYMLILEGEQGTGKSTACRILGGEYFTDALPNITSGKDAFQHLRGTWVIEIAELAATSKADLERLKAFLTRTAERYRPPYAAKEVCEPRQCIFIGTTNQSAYLKDETGGRRFWPVKVGKIDLAGLEHDRDQLLAEAIVLYNNGESWHPDPVFERQFIRPQQEARYDPDPWEADIRQHLELTKPEQVLVRQLLDVVGVGLAGRSRAHQHRVTAILTCLGWQRLKKDSKGDIPWGRDPNHG